MRNLFIAALIVVPLLVIAFFWYEGWTGSEPATPSEPKYARLQPEHKEKVEDIRGQLEIFDREGLSPAGREALGKINTFASGPLKGTVVFYEEATPWAPTTMEFDLLAAFVAGNVREIVATGDLRTDSYAGTVEVLRVYQLLKEQNPGLRVDELEAFELLDRKGKLREKLDKIDAREEKREAEKQTEEVPAP